MHRASCIMHHVFNPKPETRNPKPETIVFSRDFNILFYQLKEGNL